MEIKKERTLLDKCRKVVEETKNEKPRWSARDMRKELLRRKLITEWTDTLDVAEAMRGFYL